MRIEPWACLASRPVSKVNGWPLIMTDSRTKDMRSALLGATPRACGRRRPVALPSPCVLGSRPRRVPCDHGDRERPRPRVGEGGHTSESKSKVKGDGRKKTDVEVEVESKRRTASPPSSLDPLLAEVQGLDRL